YIVPMLPGRGPDGRGRAQTWDWPENVVERTPDELRREPVDVVILQRPHEYALVRRWLRRTPGVDIPAVYLEHNTPKESVTNMRHPARDYTNVAVAHVTHFNALFWDCGDVPTYVVEHGVIDPGYHYTGEVPCAAAVINEARRRGRVTGTDLLERFDRSVGVDLFGMDARALGGIENLPQDKLHRDLARRRLYLHPVRWTSLGLSLIEAMFLGMPVVALATTEVPRAVDGCGITSTSVADLVDGCKALVRDERRAREMGRDGRERARRQFGLQRFLNDWNQILAEVSV
ncbi:MAG: glycosyltransferase, partial [Candidatus Eremiobacteraeota bacterium]|nr:glycosyltransferase [Candidatus Eremiobacteraeota bacterium]